MTRSLAWRLTQATDYSINSKSSFDMENIQFSSRILTNSILVTFHEGFSTYTIVVPMPYTAI